MQKNPTSYPYKWTIHLWCLSYLSIDTVQHDLDNQNFNTSHVRLMADLDFVINEIKECCLVQNQTVFLDRVKMDKDLLSREQWNLCADRVEMDKDLLSREQWNLCTAAPQVQ
jgi:hypothetical protein